MEGDLPSVGALLVFLLIPLLFIVVAMLGFGIFLRTMGGRAIEFEEVEEATGEWERVPRPWWGNPLVWLGISAVLLLLGLFVAPQFLGGTFVFLPFFWIGGRRRVRPPRYSRWADRRKGERDVDL